MSSTQAALGQKALAARDYPEAIACFTIALKEIQSPLWLIQRSTAYQRSSQYELALIDAENGYRAAQARNRRELMATSQFRRAIALHGLGRFGDARICFTWVRKLNEKEKGLGMWQAKVAKDFDTLEEDAPGRNITVKEVPDEHKDVISGEKAENTLMVKQDTKPVSSATSYNAAPTATLTQTPKEKIRHEWFQSNSKVTITIFAKNVPKETVEVELEEQSLHLQFPTILGSDYQLSLLPLFAPIAPAQSTTSITPHKIEINLHKAAVGLKWSALEGTEIITIDPAASKIAHPVNTSAQDPTTPTTVKAPSYPTSSKTGPKDWDALATEELRKTRSAKDGEKETNDGEDDDMEGDPVNGFFKKIYGSADPDTRRAMMKSFTESNGTALSTNWGEVGSKTFETKPPEGVEAKKWSS